MIGKPGFGTNECDLGHRYLDFVSGAVLIRPRFNLGQIGEHACLGVFVCVLPLHLPSVSAAARRTCAANRPRNWPTSVTTPIACPVPRSLTFVATAGFMSTHTIFTQLGDMFPTAIE